MDVGTQLKMAGSVVDIVKDMPLEEAWNVIFIAFCVLYGPLWIVEVPTIGKKTKNPFDEIQ